MRDIYSTAEEDAISADSLEVTGYGDRFVRFEIDSPWSGSTEEGFGARLAMNLTLGQVRRMIDALELYLAEQHTGQRIR